MIPKTENNNYSETPPEVAVSNDFLIYKVLCEKYLTLSLNFLAMQITGQPLWDPKNLGSRAMILGRR